MKRVSLREPFHDGAEPQLPNGDAADGQDQVILNVVSGVLSFMAPSSVSDDEITQEQFLEHFVNCSLQLENGAQLLIWINSGAHGVEVQLEPPHPVRRHARKRASEYARSELR